jgi:hypothetical protein
MKPAYLGIAALGVLAVAGAASWANGGLLDERAVRGPIGERAGDVASSDRGDRGFVRASVGGRELCARWSPDSVAHASADGLAITLDCDAQDLELVDLDATADRCGTLIAQDRIDPVARCAATGLITPTERGNVRWAIGSCTCNGISVAFEVPLR